MSSGNVVVVDDNGVNRMLLSGILEQSGYVVRTATNGRDALQMIELDPPDIILLDIQMPKMSGYEVCQALKAMKRTREIPVIFISAVEDVAEKVKAFETGGVDYITKPFEPAEVLARLGTQVKLSRLQRELRQRNFDLQRRNEQLLVAHDHTQRMFGALSNALTGTVLDETYRLDEKIGEGGFGAVFRGVHIALRRQVAIKVLRPTPEADTKEQIARFRREGVAACRINHPNAVEVLDFAISSTGMPYLVMELLTGRTLGAVLRETPMLPVRRCADIAIPVCEALGAAHAAGIVHRDIKPDNVFLHQADGAEVVKVVDFGIAQIMDSEKPVDLDGITEAGTLLGTPQFMAPERLIGRPYDERSDVYSLGVVLYLALTADMPFPHSTRATMTEMINLHLTSKPRDLRELNDKVPATVADAVMQALDFDPAARPHVGALRVALA